MILPAEREFAFERLRSVRERESHVAASDKFGSVWKLSAAIASSIVKIGGSGSYSTTTFSAAARHAPGFRRRPARRSGRDKTLPCRRAGSRRAGPRRRRSARERPRPAAPRRCQAWPRRRGIAPQNSGVRMRRADRPDFQHRFVGRVIDVNRFAGDVFVPLSCGVRFASFGAEERAIFAAGTRQRLSPVFGEKLSNRAWIKRAGKLRCRAHRRSG